MRAPAVRKRLGNFFANQRTATGRAIGDSQHSYLDSLRIRSFRLRHFFIDGVDFVPPCPESEGMVRASPPKGPLPDFGGIRSFLPVARSALPADLLACIGRDSRGVAAEKKL